MSFIRSLYFKILRIMVIVAIIPMGCSLTPPDPKENNQETGTSIETQNSPPVADAGKNRSILITEASAVKIDGSDSTDPDGDTLEYKWQVMGDEVVLSDLQSRSASFDINLPSSGDYYFVLSVDDGQEKSDPSFLKISVLPPDGWVDDDYLSEDLEASHFTTIQRAIDELGKNTCIAIMPGIYKENITLDEGVHLFGVTSQFGAIPEISASVTNTEGMRAVATLKAASIIENMIISCSKSPATELNLSIVKADSLSSSAYIRNCRIQTASGFQNHYVDGISIDRNAILSISDGSKIENISGEGIVSWNDAHLIIKNTRIGYTGGSAIYAIESRQVCLSNSVIHHSGSDGLDLTSVFVDIDHCTVGYFYRAGIKLNGTTNWLLKNTLVFAGGTGAKIYDGQISINNEALDNSNLPNKNSGIDINPSFVDPENGNFQLQAKSPAAGNGENGSNVGAIGDILSQ